jgi:hypothetical protein
MAALEPSSSRTPGPIASYGLCMRQQPTASIRTLAPLLIAGCLFASFSLVRLVLFQDDIWWLSLINFLLTFPLVWLALRTRRVVRERRTHAR